MRHTRGAHGTHTHTHTHKHTHAHTHTHTHTHTFTHARTHTHKHTHMYPFAQRGDSALMVVAKKDQSKEKHELLKLLVACKANAALKDNVN